MHRFKGVFKPSARKPPGGPRPEDQIDASISPLLYSNFSPTPGQIIAISEAKYDAQGRVAELRASSTRDNLEEIQQWETLVVRLESCLSLYRSLPPEILSLIFEHFAAIVRDWLPYRGPNYLPWSVAFVCRTWRSAALEVPLLWAKIPPVDLGSRLFSSPTTVEFFDEILRRSADAPLPVHISGPFEDHTTHPLIPVLVKHSERWESATLSIAETTLVAFAGIRGRLPQLRTLKLEFWNRYRSATALNTTDLFLDAPCLTSLNLGGAHCAAVLLPWAQLTSYTERFGTNEPTIDYVLTYANNLDYLHFQSDSDFGFGHIDVLTQSIALRNVKTFRSRVVTTLTMQSLTLPSVQELELFDFPNNLLSHLHDLLSRSQASNLTRLIIRYKKAPLPGQLVDVLRQTPSLIHLDAPFPLEDDIRDLILLPNSYEDNLVPSLKTLIFRAQYDEIAVSGRQINTLGRNRCETGASNHATLTTFRFMLPNEGDCYAAQAELNGWPIGDGVPEDIADQTSLAIEWNAILHELVPELHSDVPSRMRNLDLKFKKKLSEVLEVLEECVISSSRVIYVSKLHLSLKRLSNIRENHLPGDEKYRFRERAREIVRKWDRVLLEDLPNVRWGRRQGLFEHHSLSYVPQDHELRKSEQGLKMVYGVDTEGILDVVLD